MTDRKDYREDQTEGKMDELKGRAQQAWAALTDDERLEAEGEANEARGKVRQTKGDIAETIDKAKDRFTR